LTEEDLIDIQLNHYEAVPKIDADISSEKQVSTYLPFPELNLIL
jgi:hypothetical protein